MTEGLFLLVFLYLARLLSLVRFGSVVDISVWPSLLEVGSVRLRLLDGRMAIWPGLCFYVRANMLFNP